MKNKTELLTVLVTTFFLTSFSGCAKKAEEDKPPVSLTVGPLVGIGDVKFGDSRDVIIAAFGEPDEIQAQGRELNYVASRGVSFAVDADTGLQRIKLWSDSWPTKLPFAVSTFAGKTKAAIGMGATREQIVAAYGEPDSTSTADSPSLKDVIENLHYDKLKMKCTLAHGKLVAIILQAGD